MESYPDDVGRQDYKTVESGPY